jgi:hypothetical protein
LIDTVFSRRNDEVGDGGVEVCIEDGHARVSSPELTEHAVQRAVVQLGEIVELRDASGLRVVVVGTARWLRLLPCRPMLATAPRKTRSARQVFLWPIYVFSALFIISFLLLSFLFFPYFQIFVLSLLFVHFLHRIKSSFKLRFLLFSCVVPLFV